MSRRAASERECADAVKASHCGLPFGGSLCTSSGHSLSTTARISSGANDGSRTSPCGLRRRLAALSARAFPAGNATCVPGAQFEIMVDGKPRSYRDTKIDANAAAELLKNRHPNSEVSVKDRQSGMVTVVAYRPG